MGLWSRKKTKIEQEDKVSVSQIIDLLNRGTPLSYFGKDLYSIPEVRMTINFIAEKVASVPLLHVRQSPDGDIEYMNAAVQRVLSVRTNPLQSPQVFWTHTITRYLLHNNVFMYPDWDTKGMLKAIYVLPFTNFQLVQDEEGRAVIQFLHDGNYAFYYDDILHLQRFPTGEGGVIKQATKNYVEIVGTLQSQAVDDSKNSNRIAALFQATTNLKAAHMKEKLEEFKKMFMTSENTTGFGMIGPEYTLHNLNLQTTPLNKDVMESVVEYLYNYFGASKKIVTHSASELEFEQFIDNTIKPILYQIEEELTYKLFSGSEISFNNKVMADIIDLEISTLSAKTSFYKEMIFGGVFNKNEIRKRIHVPRGPKELDEYYESKNFQSLQPGNYSVKGGEGDE